MAGLAEWLLSIDFGTSFTVAAVRVAGRAAEVIEIDGDRRMPSVVYVDDAGAILVGRTAEDRARFEPSRALRTPKVRIGDKSPLVLGGRPYRIADLIAAVLAHAGAEAQRHMGSTPAEVRLTHPATWSKSRQTTLLDAAARADLREPMLVPEPVAAAVSYADEAGVDPGGNVLVYDLGGGTFDAAILRAVDTGFAVVGRPAGDPTNGGELFDETLANLIGERLDSAVWDALNVSEHPEWQRAAAALRVEARRAKETLSSSDVADVLVSLPTGLVQQRVTRAEFEQLIRTHIEDSVDVVTRVLDDAELGPADVTAIYLAGGASRTPLVSAILTARFPGTRVSRRGDPKLALALGATSDRATPSRVALPKPATSLDSEPPEAPEPADTTGVVRDGPYASHDPGRPSTQRRSRVAVGALAITIAALVGTAVVMVVGGKDRQELSVEQRLAAALPTVDDLPEPDAWVSDYDGTRFPLCDVYYQSFLRQEGDDSGEPPASDTLDARRAFERSESSETAGGLVRFFTSATAEEARDHLNDWADAFTCSGEADERTVGGVRVQLPKCTGGTDFVFSYLEPDESLALMAGLQCQEFVGVWYIDNLPSVSSQEHLANAERFFTVNFERFIALAEKG